LSPYGLEAGGLVGEVVEQPDVELVGAGPEVPDEDVGGVASPDDADVGLPVRALGQVSVVARPARGLQDHGLL